MRLAASEMPPLSARSLDGRVHSVFRRVVNLRLKDGELLTLYANDDDRQPPGAILFTAPLDVDFSKRVAHRAAISCRAGILRIAGSDVSVDLRRARRGDGNIITPCHRSDASSWRTAWHTLIAAEGRAGLIVALHGGRPAGSLDAALAGRARKIVPQLLDAARAMDIEAAIRAARQLVGAGPGLTPSGDDFLAGFLVGARQTAKNAPQVAFLGSLGQDLSAQHGKSGDIACAYLAHAAAGRAGRPLTKLARAITDGADVRATRTATHDAMRMGHSSGSDGSFGLLCGLAAWRPELAAIIAADLGR